MPGAFCRGTQGRSRMRQWDYEALGTQERRKAGSDRGSSSARPGRGPRGREGPMEKIPVVKRLCVLLGVFAFLFLSASENAAARSTPPPTLPCSTPGPLLVTLGDSITHGVAASGESKAYPALLAAKIGYQQIGRAHV